jgi:hypothetical protein
VLEDANQTTIANQNLHDVAADMGNPVNFPQPGAYRPAKRPLFSSINGSIPLTPLLRRPSLNFNKNHNPPFQDHKV